MTATFVVEDGTGLATANSYLSVADADQYHEDYGNPASWAALTTAQKEANLRLATQYLDAVYGARWLGTKATLTQRLDWPRSSVPDPQRFYTYLDDTVIPERLESACAILALRAITVSPLVPDITNPGTIRRRLRKVGPITVEDEYQGGRSQIRQIREVDLTLFGLIADSTILTRA